MSEGTLFAIVALDRPGVDDLRVEHREGHLAHFKQHADKIAVAGPLSGPASGSLVIYRCETEQEARTFIEGDPFHGAGIWQSIDVYAFKTGIGSWVSG